MSERHYGRSHGQYESRPFKIAPSERCDVSVAPRGLHHRIQCEKIVRRKSRLAGVRSAGSRPAGLDADGLDLSDSYLRQSDLRSVDFRKTRLEGASINAAKISGAYFPAELTASEIELSFLHGTRMRYNSTK